MLEYNCNATTYNCNFHLLSSCISSYNLLFYTTFYLSLLRYTYLVHENKFHLH